MARFAYKAVSDDGEVIEGETEAANRTMVIEQLRAKGVIPIRAEPISRREGRIGSGGLRLTRGRVTPQAISHFTRELAVLLQAGLPLHRALTLLATVMPPGAMRKLIEDLRARVEGGAAFAEALEAEAAYFPPYYSGMIRAGEAGGSLEVVLEQLADVLERTLRLRASVRSAMTYPIIVLVVTLGTLALLMAWVVPEFTPLFEEAGEELPFLTQIVVGLSDLTVDYGWVFLVALLVGLVGLRRHNAYPEGRLRWDRFCLGLPLYGSLVRRVEMARFSRTLGSLLRNGVTVLNALTMANQTIVNQAMRDAAERIRGPLAKGEGLAGPMEQTGAFPALATQLIFIGEESGQLDTMLLRVAEVYDDEVQRGLQRLLAFLVPGLTLGLGLVVALIMGALVSAILGSYNVAL